MTTDQIATELVLSSETVRSHVKSILRIGLLLIVAWIVLVGAAAFFAGAALDLDSTQIAAHFAALPGPQPLRPSQQIITIATATHARTIVLPNEPYSCLSASIGSNRAAFEAGRSPNRIPVSALARKASVRFMCA